MAKAKLIRIIILIVLMASNQVHSPAITIQENTTFSYCERDEIRKLKDSQQENIQEKYDIEQPQKLPKNESPKKQAKPNPKNTQDLRIFLDIQV